MKVEPHFETETFSGLHSPLYDFEVPLSDGQFELLETDFSALIEESLPLDLQMVIDDYRASICRHVQATCLDLGQITGLSFQVSFKER